MVNVKNNSSQFSMQLPKKFRSISFMSSCIKFVFNNQSISCKNTCEIQAQEQGPRVLRINLFKQTNTKGKFASIGTWVRHVIYRICSRNVMIGMFWYGTTFRPLCCTIVIALSLSIDIWFISFNVWLIEYGTISIPYNRPWLSTSTCLRWISHSKNVIGKIGQLCCKYNYSWPIAWFVTFRDCIYVPSYS